MTQADKELLLQDLCTRLPYGVEVYYSETIPISTLKTINSEKGTCIVYDHSQWYRHSKFLIEEVKPYLRPMSSMTEEERNEVSVLLNYEFYIDNDYALVAEDGRHKVRLDLVQTYTDYLNKKMFAYRIIDGKDMFELGLALEAPKDMYK